MAMLSYQDCLAFCDLNEEEIAAIAQHEHIPMIVATELAQYLCHTPQGTPMIKRMILDDIAEAKAAGDDIRYLKLKMVLRHFVQTHPLAAAGSDGHDRP
jgi:hypothetical protein